MKKFYIIFLSILLAGSFFYLDTLKRLYQGYQGYRTSKDRAKYYLLENFDIQDITEKLIADSVHSHSPKTASY